jgi:hypothetical protein
MKPFLVIPIAISLLLLSGHTTMAHADKVVTFCDCVNKPIVTDAKHAACSKMIESMGPQKSAVESRACLANFPVPAGGPDVCFRMRSRTKDPALRKTCQPKLEKLSNKQLMSKSRECALEIDK